MRKAENLPPSCAVVMKSGNLSFLEPSGPLQACNGTDLPRWGNNWLEVNPASVPPSVDRSPQTAASNTCSKRKQACDDRVPTCVEGCTTFENTAAVTVTVAACQPTAHNSVSCSHSHDVQTHSTQFCLALTRTMSRPTAQNSVSCSHSHDVQADVSTSPSFVLVL